VQPAISLCVVARNEETYIGACLASASGLADERIVLDTGSSDLTRTIARRAGARVIRMRWPDDYAVAFNAVRQAARGQWILNLDADEVLDPAAPALIRTLLDRPPADAFRVTIHNYSYFPTVKWRAADPRSPLSHGASGWTPSCTIRLFRNDPRFRYSSVVHHTLVPSIRRSGGRIADAPFTIHHHGLLWRTRCGAKPFHYLRLTTRKVRQEPESGRAWIERGVTHAELGEHAEALDCFTRAQRLEYGAGAWFHSGRVHCQRGDDRRAVADFQEAIRLHAGDRHEPDCDLADLLEYLGHALERIGRPAQAESSYRRALAARRDSPMAVNSLADLLSRRGKHQDAHSLISELIRRYPAFDMPRATLGNIHFRSGDYRAAETAYRTALAVQPENMQARRNLARALSRQGRARAAARAWRLVVERDPEAPSRFETPAPLSAAHRMPPVRARGDARLIVSIVSHLGGGAGRVVIEVIRALPGYRHLVLCGDPGSYAGLEYQVQLRELGATVTVVAAGTAAKMLRASGACLVLHHWWPSRIFDELDTECPVPRVLISHCPAPMPKGAAGYVVLSEYNRRTQGHLPRGMLSLIPNAVDLRAYSATASRKSGRLRIAMLSRLDMDKFPRRLLAHLPDLAACGGELVIAGRGPRRFEIESELSGTPWARRIRFAGVIRPARVPGFLAEAQVGLHLTEMAAETCSLAVIEMLASGLPVVSQPRGCLPEMVVPGENGFLSEDETEIAAALDRLLRDERLRRRMGEASRRRARTYGYPRFAAAYRQLVRKLI